MKILMICILSFLSQLGADQESQLNRYLEQLIRMPTITSDKAENLKALEWVESELRSLPLYFQYHTFNGHSSLVITTQDTKTPDVFLVAHMDVVPCSPEFFEPKRIDGKIFGRGAYDMKVAIACYLLALPDLLRYNIGIMLTTDEEIGGMNGVKKLLEIGYRSKVALLPDGGFDWHFEEMAKGVLHLKLLAQGQAAHGSRPWEGKNAIESLNKALEKLLSCFQKKSIGDYYPTLNIGKIQGGTSTNQVPESAEAFLDIRFPPFISEASLLAEIHKILENFPDVSFEKVASGSPSQSDLNKPFFKMFQEIAKEKYGISIKTMNSHGSSDARFFGELQIPTLVITCNGANIHSPNEWVDSKDAYRFYQVMKAWAIQVSNKLSKE